MSVAYFGRRSLENHMARNGNVQTPATPTRDALVEAAVAGISRDGLDDLTLRDVATAAGCSPAGVFLYFAGKRELIAEAMRAALEEDAAWHDSLDHTIDGLTLSSRSLLDLVSSYLRLRSICRTGPFWSEILFKAADVDDSVEPLRQWISRREAFWRNHLERMGLDGTNARTLNTYVMMEEVYSFSLWDGLDYVLLVGETLRALVARLTNASPDNFGSEITSFMSRQSVEAHALALQDETSSLKEQLLEVAIPEILKGGIRSLNLRRVAKRANRSLSMITYHFGDTGSFINEAVWRALFKGIPKEIDPNSGGGVAFPTLQEWADRLGELIDPRGDEHPAGFYIGVARLTGQAALQARRVPELKPLILHLRKIEGSGTYRASQTIWPPSCSIARSAAAAFGIWVKGQAVMNETVCDDEPVRGPGIEHVVKKLLS
ncbi:TetR/AcrR family transcriptional regulator [Sphingomonas sp. ID0503]|uniref:TetR/AcrR family transcriptional regulator n=1 Tax=Sphingomonas sp. ID0503 TaxID=3399691 RepID=UPI003AFA5ED8